MTKKYFTAIDPSLPFEPEPELVVIENFLPEKTCNQLIANSHDCPATPTAIGNFSSNGQIERTSTHGFIADRIDLPTSSIMRKLSLEICRNIYKNLIPRHYKAQMKSFEFPHVLRYGPGGTYGPHSDSHNWDPATNSWVKVLNRDYSSILYLNSDFTGGNLAFPGMNMRLQPQTGMLVLFPSDGRFVHTAEPTLSGTRYALVTWGAKRGVKGISNAPKGNIVKLK